MSSHQEERSFDPKRLLEMAMEGLSETPGARPEPLPAAEIERALPQFEVAGLIGQGGMGAVYKAREKKLDRLVALKVLPRELVPDPAFEERFLREARAQASLSHPHILTIHDFGETDAFFYIVSEYVDGVDLRRMMQLGRLSPAEALRLVPPVCDALQFAHDRGVIHRDIKPENILIDQDGNVRIADFGLAKMMSGNDVTLTRTEQVLGTPHYMAPEQMSGASDVDHRADIYALGVVIYEMLTGDLPMGNFAMPSQKAGTRKELDEVVMRALAQAVEDRYQRADQVKSDVEGVPEKRRVERPRTEEARLCKRPLVGLLICVLSAIGLGVVMFLAVQAQQQAAEYRANLRVYEDTMEMIQVQEKMTSTPWTGDRPVHPGPAPTAGIGAMEVTSLGGAFAFLNLLTVMLFGFSGIRAIQRSKGRLRGMGLAVFTAWILPVLLINAAILAPLTLLSDPDAVVIMCVALGLALLMLDFFFLRWVYLRAEDGMAATTHGS